MNDDQNKKEVLDQEENSNSGLTKKQAKALRRKEFFKSHPKLEWFYNHMTLTAILSFFFVLFVVFFFRGCTEDTSKYNSSIQNNNSSLVESTSKKAWIYDEDTDTITSDNLLVLENVAEKSNNGITYSVSNGVVTASGTATSAIYWDLKSFTLEPGTYYFKSFGETGSNSTYFICLRDNNDFSHIVAFTFGNVSFTLTETTSFSYLFVVRNGVNVPSGTRFNDILVHGFIVPVSWTPGGTYVNKTEYDELQEKYNGLLASYNTLQENYNSLVASHNELQNEYDTLNTNYNTLNSDYETLQASYNALQTQYNNLKTLYDNLVSTFNELNGSNAFGVSNLGPFVFVTKDGTTNKLPILQLPNFESRSLGSSLPLIYNADEIKYTYNTPVYFKQGTIVRLSTTHTYSYPINVKISLYDSENSLIGDFNITFGFSPVSLTGVYVGSYEFVSDVGNISSIVFTDISSNGELGVTSFDLASDPYQRGYNNGYLARSDDYYQMLNNYNEEVEKYNALLDEYQTYKQTYNSDVVASARAAGIEEGANADNALSDGFLAVFNAPFALTYRLLDFNVLGLNMWVLAVSLASIVVLVKLVKVIF